MAGGFGGDLKGKAISGQENNSASLNKLQKWSEVKARVKEAGECKHHLRSSFPPPPEARSPASLDGGLFTFSIRMIQTWHVCLFGASRCVFMVFFPTFPHGMSGSFITLRLFSPPTDGQSIVNNLILNNSNVYSFRVLLEFWDFKIYAAILRPSNTESIITFWLLRQVPVRRCCCTMEISGKSLHTTFARWERSEAQMRNVNHVVTSSTMFWPSGRKESSRNVEIDKLLSCHLFSARPLPRFTRRR